MSLENIYKLTILEHHLDTFGHVNNATYIALFEEARWDLITRNGYGLKTVREKKIGPVVLQMDVQFKKELLLREDVEIRSTMVSYEKKIAKLKQVIFNSKNEESCSALFTFGLMDLTERKLILPTPEWLKGLGLPV